MIHNHLETEDGLLLNTEKGQMRIVPIAENILHITYTLEQEFSSKASLMIVPQERAKVDWHVDAGESMIRLTTKLLAVVVDRVTGAFSYLDKAGNLLAKEPKRGGKILVQTEVIKAVFDENTDIRASQSVDGIRAYAENYTRAVDRKAYHSKLEFEWTEEEALYGLGSHEEGIMNLRGHHQYLYQQNMKAVVPMLISTKGYGILMDSYSQMTFHDDVYGSYIWTDIVDEMDFYFIYGPEMDSIVSGYRKLTGKVPMLPKWAFGYVQSKERYKSQEEILSVVKEFRERKIPLDLIVLDWQSWPGELWGEKSFDPQRFPDPEGMMEQLHTMNVQLMISIWPIMKAGGSNHEEMLRKNYLLANKATYDAFNEEARALYWKHAQEGLFSKGIDAWWCDCTEPFEADWDGEVKPEPEERLNINAGEAKKYLDPQYINAYSLLHSKGIYEGQRKATEEKRVVNLTRSSYAGQQRYATITWSGDISASWDTLRRQIPEGLNFCITGCPYWTLDIGAFFVEKKDKWFWDGQYDAGCEDMGYRELYVRWFQYGAFLPMFRSHGTDTPREIWRFGEPGTVFYDTLVNFIHLRYRLMPYIYSLAGRVTQENYTMVRALAFDFQKDSKTYNIKDQYMFGPAILVCPVTRPMYYESGSREIKRSDKTRRVYLPTGNVWYDFWTGEPLEGGQTFEADAPMDRIPLYIRAGSILPMGPYIQYTKDKPGAPIELRIYTGKDGVFTLYEDEGDNYNYEKGSFSLIHIQWKDRERKLIIGERQGTFTGMIENRMFTVTLVSAGRGVGRQEENMPDYSIEYDGMETEIIFN